LNSISHLFKVLVQQHRVNYTTVTKYTKLTELMYITHFSSTGPVLDLVQNIQN